MARWNTRWSVADIDKIKNLASKGLSASAIAEIIGGDATRNAIIGLCARNSISLIARKMPGKIASPKSKPAKQLYCGDAAIEGGNYCSACRAKIYSTGAPDCGEDAA